MKNVLVTGAAGFIGSHVCERLLADGSRVMGIDNFDPFYPAEIKRRNLGRSLAHGRFTLINEDILNGSEMCRLMADFRPDAVIHLAAKAGVRPSLSDPQSYMVANVAGTASVLEACRRANVAHFVLASSSSVYGDSAVTPFKETARTDSSVSPYAASKKACESLAHSFHHVYGMNTTCLRFFTVYGPRQRPDLAIARFTDLISKDQPVPVFGDGTTSRDYTFVLDTVDGIVRAMERPCGYGIYNLGNHTPVSLNDMVAVIADELCRTPRIVRMPDQPGDVRTTYADISAATSDLGYQPSTSFRDGIRRYVRWYRAAQFGVDTCAVGLVDADSSAVVNAKQSAPGWMHAALD